MNEPLTPEGRIYAHDCITRGVASQVAIVALWGEQNGWPPPMVRAAIRTMNEAATETSQQSAQ